MISYVSQTFQRCPNKARRKIAREHPQPCSKTTTSRCCLDWFSWQEVSQEDGWHTLVNTCSSPGRYDVQWVTGPGKKQGCPPNHTEGTSAFTKCCKLHLQNQTRSNPDTNLSSILRKLLQTKYKNQSERFNHVWSMANRVDVFNSFNNLALFLVKRPSRQAWCQAGQQQHMQTWNMKTTETHSRHKKETCQSQKFGHNQIGKNRDTSDKTTKSVNVTTRPSKPKPIRWSLRHKLQVTSSITCETGRR